LENFDSALSVQPGSPQQPASVAADTSRFRRRRRLSRADYVDGVLQGDRTILGQAITLIESNRAADAELAQDVLHDCLPHTGESIRLGITGVPGAGKSTTIEALGTFLTRERGERVAVLAVDPSSQISHGSILGDKTRMEQLAVDPKAFIRPTPSGGSLGGVARRTRETMLLCEAAGFRNVIVETVGVGQSETAVRTMVDFFLLLMIAGAGDELQGMKRGIMEMTDLIAINKADGDNKPRAEIARREYESALHLFPVPASGWVPRVVTCSAYTREGISALWENVLEQRAWMQTRGLFEAYRKDQARTWMYGVIDQALREQFASHLGVRHKLPELEGQVAAGQLSPFRAAQMLIDIYTDKKS
jgi:LAO/AO transport system kinase